MKGKNLINQRFGRLLVIKDTGERTKHGEKLWLCKCDCGNYHDVMTSNLTGNKIKSCGCLRNELSGKRGKTTIKAAQNIIKDKYVDGTYISQLQSKTRINNTSGYKGVYWSKHHNKWVAHLTLKGKKKSLGYYDDLTDAIEARKKGEEEYFIPIIEKYRDTD